MGRIFSILALLQIAGGWIARMLGKLADSFADSQPGYYGLAGEWVYVDPTDDPTHTDPQAGYSAANLAAQQCGHADVWTSYSEALRDAQTKQDAHNDWAAIMRAAYGDEYRDAS